ncbi:MAG: hypothetical protein GX991_01365 [Clostridiaceae bacterium]|nr:hypothetical protein [Clostridiaceae bacterium]
MARYCFYCGRELEENGKCRCRERSFASSKSYTSTAPQQAAKPAGATTPPPDSSYTSQQTQRDSRTTANTSGRGERTARPSWTERRADKRARKEAKRQAKARQTQQKNQYSYGGTPPYRQDTAQRKRAARQNILSGFVRFFATPALHMTQSLSTVWTLSHTVWLSVAILLSGMHYFNLNRFLSAVQAPSASLELSFLRYVALSWLTGIIVVAVVILLFTSIMWLIARFFYRQRALPFRHTLAVGKVAWQYLVLFFALSLPSVFSGNSLFGVVLALMGVVFSAMIHARQVTSLIHLDDNRKWQFIYLSIIMFAGVFSTIATLSRFITILR